MKKLCAISLILPLLLAVGTEGMVTYQKNGCKCPIMTSRSIPVRLVANVEVLPVSSSCNKVEYIATRKDSGKRQCLNLTLPEVQIMYKKYLHLKKTQPRWRTPIRPQ